VRPEKNYSDSETSSEESDTTSDVGATTWVKGDRTNQSYLQNQGKYDSSSKVLKWVGVSVVCATQKKGVKPGTCVSSA
jgi:hypothetical protein